MALESTHRMRENTNIEAECNCQICHELIAFPLELVGQTTTCPHCQAETLLLNPPADSPPAPNLQPQIANSDLSKLFDCYLHKQMRVSTPEPRFIGSAAYREWLANANEANYILYLKPGDVRYLQVRHFVGYEVEQWIAYFKQMSLTPEIRGPYGREKDGLDVVSPEDFYEETTWEDTFKILHSFALLFRDYGVPSAAYRHFHTLLRLRSLEFTECINSWVKEAWNDYFTAQSYVKSEQHLLIEIGNTSSDPETARFAVFKKTPYVVQRLEELRLQEDAEKTSENLEQLRRSNFKIYVYLMEDLRNGLFKIGQSQTPEKREKTLQSEVPETALRFYIPAHDTAEKELHELFAEKRVRGEWFGFNPDDVMVAIGFLKRAGDLDRVSVDYEWLGKISFGIRS